MQIPAHGHPLHTRALTMFVELRQDGRWRVRGDVVDLRKCGFVPMGIDIQPAGLIHHMTIDAVVDPATRVLESLETDQPYVAIEPSAASEGECCRDPAPRLQALAGERLGAGFGKRLGELFGGPLGCSHLLTLFQLMASAIPLALDQEEALQAREGTPRRPGERLFRRSAFVDGVELASGEIGIGVQLGDFHTRPAAVVVDPLARLARNHDARAWVEVGRPSLAMSKLAVAERVRSGAPGRSVAWRDRLASVAELEGQTLLPGLAGRLFRLLPHSGDSVVRDALLQLGPGYIQIMAAVMDRWLETSAGGGDARAGMSETGSVGGMPDACYMWRRGGPMTRLRAGPSLESVAPDAGRAGE